MESLGEFLKKGRAEAGVSLEDLAQRTRIRIENLQSLEREDLDALPTDIYVRGFVKLVCRELGLAPEDGLVRYETIRQQTGPPDEIIWSEDKEASEPSALERALGDPERVVKTVAATIRWGGMGLGALVVVVLVVVGVRAIAKKGDGAPAVSSADAPREVAAAEAAPAPAERPPVEEKKTALAQEQKTAAPEPAAVIDEKPAEPRSGAAGKEAAGPVVTLALVDPVIPERKPESIPAATSSNSPPAPESSSAAPPPESSRAQVARQLADIGAPSTTGFPLASTLAPERSRVAEGARIELVVEALRPVEVAVLLDGIGHPREKTLAAGERKTWKADSLFLLSVSDGGAVRLSLQGVELGSPGPDGVPVRWAPIRPSR